MVLSRESTLCLLASRLCEPWISLEQEFGCPPQGQNLLLPPSWGMNYRTWQRGQGEKEKYEALNILAGRLEVEWTIPYTYSLLFLILHSSPHSYSWQSYPGLSISVSPWRWAVINFVGLPVVLGQWNRIKILNHSSVIRHPPLVNKTINYRSSHKWRRHRRWSFIRRRCQCGSFASLQPSLFSFCPFHFFIDA